MSPQLRILMDAAQYAVNRLDADNKQPQVAGDLAVALAAAKSIEARRFDWENFQALFPDQDYSEVFDESSVTELLETSSVTVKVGRRTFVITVEATEIDDDMPADGPCGHIESGCGG